MAGPDRGHGRRREPDLPSARQPDPRLVLRPAGPRDHAGKPGCSPVREPPPVPGAALRGGPARRDPGPVQHAPDRRRARHRAGSRGCRPALRGSDLRPDRRRADIVAGGPRGRVERCPDPSVRHGSTRGPRPGLGSGTALLHERHDRSTEGSRADARQRADTRADGDRRTAPARNRRLGAHRTDVPPRGRLGDVRDHGRRRRRWTSSRRNA